MKRKGLMRLIYFTFLLISLSCEKETPTPKSNFLSFPIGRSFLTSSDVKVKIGGIEYIPQIVSDRSGGYWIAIPREDISEGQLINIQFTRRKEDLVLYADKGVQVNSYTSPTYYIDSDNEEIINRAKILSLGLTTNIEKAKRIQQYIYTNIKTDVNKKYSNYVKASQTLKEKNGTCMNTSRLFVALCRAANVPARSIWGVISGVFHHQWAEARDESGKWHAADFGFTRYFDLNDIRYLDLIYNAEENDFLMNRDTTEIMFPNLIFHNNYPNAKGDLDFRLVSEHLPDSITAEYTYVSGKLFFQ